MRIFRSFGEAGSIPNPVVTTGSFDGVHIGHKTIINRLKMLAMKHNGESVLVTFHPHPRKVLYPETAGRDLRLINSQEEKIMLLEKAGVDNVIIIEFTREFSRITSEEFVRDLLCGELKAKVIVVGFNHHFGFNKEGDYRKLWGMREKYGFEAEEIPEQEVEHETVSSTRIRKAITDGYIQRANAYLDHHYIVVGQAERTDAEITATGISFCRIPVTDENKLLPAGGVYAVTVDSGAGSFKGMIVVIPSDVTPGELFLHLPSGVESILGQRITILFQKRISGPIALNPHEDAASRLKSSIGEINELVY